jgi:hypothetical protein
LDVADLPVGDLVPFRDEGVGLDRGDCLQVEEDARHLGDDGPHVETRVRRAAR